MKTKQNKTNQNKTKQNKNNTKTGSVYKVGAGKVLVELAEVFTGWVEVKGMRGRQVSKFCRN